MLYNNKNPKDIERYAKLMENKSIYEIIPEEATEKIKQKGGIGNLIEEYYFHYKPNSHSEADFSEAGVELKVTPYKINRNNTYAAKERLVLNIINYMEEYKESFETSSFWKKNKLLLLVFYMFKEGYDRKDFKITHTQLFEFPEKDLKIIMKDWQIIVNKIREGKAHEISERDTLYLAACTKGVNKGSTRQQPFSDVPAKQRAFSLKSSYMTFILNEFILNRKKTYKSIAEDSGPNSLDEYILERFLPFYGKTLSELKELFGIPLQRNDKATTYRVAAKMLNNELEDLNNTEEFLKSNTKIKAIRVQKNGKIKESMSFPTFKYEEIIHETWEESTLREMFQEMRFLFVIYLEDGEGDYVFTDAFIWSVPEEDLENDIRWVWEETVRRILANQAHKLPTAKENRVSHVRPHARNGADTYPTHYGKNLVKKCFWLNNSYILENVLKYSEKTRKGLSM